PSLDRHLLVSQAPRGPSERRASLSRHSTQTGEKTADTIESVARVNPQPISAPTIPKEPKCLPSEFSVELRKNGDRAVAPPITTEATSAPGRSARRPIWPCRSKRGVQSQNAVETTSQTGTTAAQRACLRPPAPAIKSQANR